MGDKATLTERVNSLLINPDAIEKIEVHLPGFDDYTIPNAEGKRNSLQIYAAITSNRGWINPEAAEQGLRILGGELCHDCAKFPDKHPSIELLEEIVTQELTVRSNIHRRPEAKPLPFSDERIKELLNHYPTPFIVYDEAGIRQTAQALNKSISQNFYAVKACPNPSILDILAQEGMGADCSSAPELTLANRVGIKGEDIMFTSNDTPAEEFRRAKSMGAVINFDDITHIDYFLKTVGALPELVCCRFNPGSARVGNSIIGNPIEAKYGFTQDQILPGLAKLKANGVKRFGLHTMVASNERNSEYFVETARMMFNLYARAKKELGIEVEFLNLGGGLGTPYRPEHRAVDLDHVSNGIRKEFEFRVANGNLRKDLQIFMECGRYITGPHGFLVSKVRHPTKKYKDFVGLDACMANLMRPGMYDAYHHISVLGKDSQPRARFYNVTGSLCENNDQFAFDRALPEIQQGDVFVIHNAGAHGYAMGFNYNGKLRCAEVLVKPDGRHKKIRSAETEEDYF